MKDSQELALEVTADLAKINGRLRVEYKVEDLYGQDFEEYGVEDIEETRTMCLMLDDADRIGSVVVMRGFSFDSWFGISRDARELLSRMGLGSEDIERVAIELGRKR